MLTIQELSQETGLSPYLLSVFYDFYEHRLLPVKERGGIEKHKERLVAIYNNNPDITPIRKKPSENEIRLIVKEYEQSLPKVSHLERDEMMVRKFLTWARTHSGHFLLVHYHGPARERKEMVKVENWSPLHKKYLGFFHTRFAKDRSLSLPLQMNYLDLEDSGDGKENLSVDVRFVVNKWFDSASEKQKEFLQRGRVNFPRKPLYLIKQLPQERGMSQKTQINAHTQSVSDLISPLIPKLSTNTKKEEEKWEEEEGEELDDPYEVKEEKYRRVSKDEYSNKQVIHKDMHFTLHDWLEASRASFLSKKHKHPLQYYTFDPIRLVDASCIAFHLEGQMKRACSQIPLKHIQVVQNNDMIPILNFFAENKQAKEDLNRYYVEYIYALMCLENTTSHLPPTISDLLNDVFEELTTRQ